MNFPVQAITLDLDDTLWPFAPIGARIDQVLYEWMLQHSPATAAMYPVAAMRELRERSFRDNPHLHYDLSALRRLTLREALENSGADLALHTIEGQVVTPIVLGRQMAISPLILILALMVFGWLWGMVGLLLSVPLLVCIKLVLARLDGTQGWAKLLE